MTETVFEKLSAVARQGDDLDMAGALLQFAALIHEGISTDRYKSHLQKLTTDIHDRHQELIKAGADDNAGARLAALKDVISIQQNYVLTPDPATPDDIKIETLITTIDSAQGSRALLAFLYIHCGRQLGWAVEGLNIPGHFIARIDEGGDRIMFDPADECRPLQAHDIRDFVKAENGEGAEISTAYFEPLSNHNIVMNVQNQIKLNYVRAEDYPAALLIVQALQAFAPQEFRLSLDAGILYARTDQPESAIFALEHYISKTPDDRSRQEAQMLLQDLRGG